MKKQKIFLASSSELKEDREQFEIFISRENKEWIKKDVFLELNLWEDFLDAMSQTRLQDEYNKAINECDIFIMLFFTKVGKYTEEEFEKAFKHFKINNKPFIYTYFKNAQIWTRDLNDDIVTLLQFQRKLNVLGHFVTRYKSVEDLKYQFSNQLEKLHLSEFNQMILPKEVQQPFKKGEFTDKHVNEVLDHLHKLHADHGEELPATELLSELSLLFERKTFRFEELRGCPEQRWADRLDSAYQTLKLLSGYRRNIRKIIPLKYKIFLDLIKELEKYCMQMGALLFEPPVDYNQIEDHVGRNTFKANLPKEIRFPVGSDKQPKISDAINGMIEHPRLNAIKFMDQLAN